MKLGKNWLLLAICFGLVGNANAAEDFILVQSTTSTQNSGLYEAILPQYTAATGVEIRIVAVGTGQAIRNAENCDADVLFVHAKPAEEKFVAAGFGLSRTDVMYNDFVIVGPASDPAGIAGSTDIEPALVKIRDAAALFASRGDDSGTHKTERLLWSAADVDPLAGSGSWYRETGSGMGATLNTGLAMNAYVLTDRATWIAFNNKGDYQIVVEGDAAMFNQYGIILVNPAHCPSVKVEQAQAFIDWVLSKDGQEAIAGYRIGDQQLFFPNAPVTN